MGPRLRFGLLLALVTLACGPVHADAPIKTEDHVVLKSGKILAGRVTGTEQIGGKSVLVVETDFGEMRIPKKDVKKAVEPSVDEDETRRLSRIRVVRIVGTVERHPKGAEAWQPVAWKDRYEGQIANVDNAIVEPGDTIRTGSDGTLDFMATKDVWIRVGKSTEVELPVDQPGAPSLALKQGRALVDIRTRARGRTFRVRTPLQTLSTREAVAEIESDDPSERVAVGTGSVRADDSAVEAGSAVEVTSRGSTSRDLTDSERYGFRERRWRLPKEDMVMVPAGTYRLAGKSPREGDKTMYYSSFGGEIRQGVEAFLMDRLEVTNGDFAAFLGAVGGEPPTYFVDGSPPKGHARRPILNVDVVRIEAFCAWRGVKLPTEVEWEVAARGPKSYLFPWGNTWEKKHDMLLGMHGGLAPDDPPPEVGSPLDVSPFGVEGMVSGVAEWTRSHPCDPPYFAVDDHMPGVAEGYRPTPEVPFRVIRGVYGSTRYRSNHRLETGILNAGFRCVLELEE